MNPTVRVNFFLLEKLINGMAHSETRQKMANRWEESVKQVTLINMDQLLYKR